MSGTIWASFVAIFQKEFLHIFRDRGTLAMALTVPIFQMILFGFIDQTVRDVPMVVVDQDQTQYSRELMDQLRATKTFKITRVTPDPRVAREDITAGRVRAGVVIPPDYHDLRARNLPAKVLVLIDGSDSTVSAQALASVNGIASQISIESLQKAAPGAEMPLSVQPIILFNPEGRTANYIIPGLVAILLQIVAIVLTAIAIVRERERGNMELLIATPLTSSELMVGKVLPYIVIGLVQTSVILALGITLFAVPIRGGVLDVYLASGLLIVANLSLGLLISTQAQSQFQAMQMTFFVFLPSILLSGFMFPFAGMPRAAQWIAEVLPLTHFLRLIRGVMLRGAGLLELWPDVLALVAFIAVMMTAAVLRFRKRLD